jgi:membrane-bound lytic murein transglycosylase D
MYKIFGDWDLVLASYNSGPGNVAKAIRRSGGQQNYWNIRKNLPKETQGYVPAFLATMYIYEYHKEHGIVPNRALVKHFSTDTIRIKKQMTFKQISDLLDVSVAQLQILNPSYKLNVIPFYHNEDHYLRLPQEKIAVFTSNEDQIYAYTQYESNKRERPFQIEKAMMVKDTANYTIQKIALPKITYYKVKRGDNLHIISRKYDVEVADIKKWNKLKSNVMAYGKSLKIVLGQKDFVALEKSPKIDPVPSNKILNNPIIALAEVRANKGENIKNAPQPETIVANETTLYVIQKGDNLGSIAAKYDVTVAEIQRWNRLSNSKVLLGASLQIVKKESDRKKEVGSDSEPKYSKYVVLQGDNLGDIAKKFGASVTDIKQWNNLPDNAISVGATLIVAKDEIVFNTNKAMVSAFKKKTNTKHPFITNAIDYYVKKGDSLYSISKKYPGVTISDLQKWNGISSEELKPGMKLKING